MKTRTLPLLGAAALGFATAVVCVTAWTPRPARAQLKGYQGGAPTSPLNLGSPTPAAPQPLEIQALDGEHFVVATREPRLLAQIGREGTAQNMLVTVVTHYTVRGERLLPVEHVRVPTGFRLITVEE